MTKPNELAQRIDTGTSCRAKSKCPGSQGLNEFGEFGDELLISFKFGSLRYDKIPFLECVNKVLSFLKVYEDIQISFKKYGDKEQPTVSWWSEVLAFKDPPTMMDWTTPRIRLGFAKRAYERGEYHNAKIYLNVAVKDYNNVYKKYITYQNALRGGAATAINIIEITIIVLASSMGGSAAVASKSLFFGASSAAGLTFFEKTALELGKLYYGVDDKFDIASVAKDTIVAFVGSLIGGKLSNLFFAKIQARMMARGGLPVTTKNLAAYAQRMQEKGLLVPGASNMNKFITGFSMGVGAETLKVFVQKAIVKSAGKSLTTDEFVGRVADEIPDGVIDEMIRRSKTMEPNRVPRK